APAPAAAIALAAKSHALTENTGALPTIARDGHALAVSAIFLAVGAALVALALSVLEERWRPPRSLVTAWSIVLVAALLVGFAGAWAQFGSPPTIARKGYHAFVTAPPPDAA